jgi:hypothetical protein
MSRQIAYHQRSGATPNPGSRSPLRSINISGVEGTTEGLHVEPSGTYADDPGNKVRDQGHQGGIRVSGEDSRVRTAPINGTMHTPAAPVNGTVCTQTAQSNG